MFFTKSNLQVMNKSHFTYQLVTNSGFITKKKQEPRSKYINGPILRLIPRKKVKLLYSKTL